MIESKFVVSWDEELGVRRGALTAKECGVRKKLCMLIWMMITQGYTFVKTHQAIHFK